MAITNAQQYQQLVKKDANGKRPGYRGDAAYRSFSAQSTGSQRGSATKSEVGGGKSRDNEPSLRDDPNVKQVYKDSKDDQVFKQRRELKKEVQRQEKEKAEEKVERFRNKQFTGLPFPGVTSLLNPLFKKGMTVNRNFFLDKVLGAGRLGDLTPEEFANLSLSEQEAAYKDYMSNRLAGKTDAYGNPTRGFSYDSEGNLVGNFIDDGGPDQPIIPMTPTDPTDPTDPTTPPPSTDVFAGIAPRFAGSKFDFDKLRANAMDGGMIEDTPVGGIMDLESGRQMYFLGKLVKKATRAVKKVAKSPIGKAALLYFGAGALGNLAGGSGLGGMFRGAMSPSKFLARSKLSNIFSGEGAKNILFGGQKLMGNAAKDNFVDFSGILGSGGKFSIGKGLTLGFGLPLALDLMGVGKDDDKKMDLDEYYRTQGINIADIRNNPYNYLADRFRVADGGRINYQEGGDAEPVAKKTMPLLDMDGKEKDYRETGGFVDMGRMERADDVPARLSKNEFVFTADAVRNAGEGDIDKGAEVMYNMMKNLEAGGEVSEESQGLEGARKMFQTSQRLGEVL